MKPVAAAAILGSRASAVVGATMKTVSRPWALAGLLGRQVQGQHRVDPGRGRRPHVGVHAVGEDEVVVGVEDDRHLALLAQAPHELQDARRGHAALEGALRRQLVGGPVGQRVGKGDAELEDVGPARDHRPAGGERGVKIRIARAEVRDEGGAPLGTGRGEGGGEAGHGRDMRRRKAEGGKRKTFKH
jgi:hypothetical protein